jgi:hypothetical protein
MCYLASKEVDKEGCVKRIADKPIKVVKVMGGEGRPYFRTDKGIGFYREGHTYTSRLGVATTHGEHIEIEEGLYSYYFDGVEWKIGFDEKVRNRIPNIIFTAKGSGLVYRFPIWDRKCGGTSLAFCEVPSGSVYYMNRHGVIVSDTLKVNKIIDLTGKEYLSAEDAKLLMDTIFASTLATKLAAQKAKQEQQK